MHTVGLVGAHVSRIFYRLLVMIMSWSSLCKLSQDPGKLLILYMYSCMWSDPSVLQGSELMDQEVMGSQQSNWSGLVSSPFKDFQCNEISV